MSLAELLKDKAGIRISSAGSAIKHDSQVLIAGLLVVVATCDGGVSTEEGLRMVQLLRRRFDISPGEAVSLLNRAADELALHGDLDDIVSIANESLVKAQKEDLMTMVLEVIAADNRKEAAEMRLLATLIERLEGGPARTITHI